VSVKKIVRKQEPKEILRVLNRVYSETESREEASLRERSKKYFSKKILKEEFSCRRIKK
jgi:hypothetical protein